jgi:hypothetical protein
LGVLGDSQKPVWSLVAIVWILNIPQRPMC